MNNNANGRILIVDADKNFADILYLCLEEASLIPALDVNNAPASVKATKHGVPDLIIADSFLIDNVKG